MRELKTNKSYRHFKGTIYRVLYVGFDSENKNENGEPIKLVVYQANHDGKIWVRPYDNFMSKVDTIKYPNADQEYRFEEVD